MQKDRIQRALELVQELEALLSEGRTNPSVRMAEALVRALRDELQSLLRRNEAA